MNESANGRATRAERGSSRVLGLLAEFDSDERLIAAASRVRDIGVRRWDCHTPYPVHGLDAAMGIRATFLPWLVLAAGLTGLGTAIWLQWWTNAVNYPFIISGKPYWSVPANVPIMFELMVLFAGLTAFGSVLLLNRLPSYYLPMFRSERFRRATDDRFFIWIDRADERFGAAESVLTEAGALQLELIAEDADA